MKWHTDCLNGLIEWKGEGKEMEDRTFTTLDVHLAAFLALKGIEPQLVSKGNRVIFSFPNDAVWDLVDEFNCNSPVPIADFVSVLKALRGRMYDARGKV